MVQSPAMFIVLLPAFTVLLKALTPATMLFCENLGVIIFKQPLWLAESSWEM